MKKLTSIENKLKKAKAAKSGDIKVYYYKDGIHTRTNTSGEIIEKLNDKEWAARLLDGDDTVITATYEKNWKKVD